MNRSPASVIVREGSVRIRVWRNYTRTTDGRTYESWEFRYRDENGRPHRCNRIGKARATAKAREIAGQLANRAATDWSAEETASFRAVKNNLFGCRVTPEAATAEYAEARGRLRTIGRQSILEAVDFYVAHHRGAASDKSVAVVVAELLLHRKQDGAGFEHLRDLKNRLARFSKDVKVRVGDLAGPVIDGWLRGLDVGRRTRKNYRGAVGNLVSFARDRGYLPKDSAPMKTVPVPKAPAPARGILAPEQMKWILASCTDSLLPVLALGAFAGLRQSETLLLQWSDIDWKLKRIRVPEEGKTGGRLVPMKENLRAWLEPLRGHGRIVPISKNGISKAIGRTVAKANVALARKLITWRIKWPHNAPRHSYASYRCAESRNVAVVADEMGHSVRELARSYRNQKATPEDATAWFELRPDQAWNVLELPGLFDAPPAANTKKAGEA